MKTYIERRSQRAALYLRMARRYGKMTAGKSYVRRVQGLGKHFDPGRLSGYYDDLSSKTEWQGPVDRAGLPFLRAPGRKHVHHPSTPVKSSGTLGQLGRQRAAELAPSGIVSPNRSLGLGPSG